MKIKTNGNIIGIICRNNETEVVYNALVDYGIDSYTIYSETRDGKTVFCFCSAALPCLTRNRSDSYTWVPNTESTQPQKVGIAHPSTVERFRADFPQFYDENKKKGSLYTEVCDYFNVHTASIGGKRLLEYA